MPSTRSHRDPASGPRHAAALPIADGDYDALIIGARVAGATLAALLGDGGHRVLLVDRDSFPSPTLSTHYFRGGRAVSVLKRLGVLDEILALGCPPLTCEYRFVDGATAPVVGPAQQPGDVAYCLSVARASLDHILVRRAARSAPVSVLQATALKEVMWSDGCAIGARLATPDGEVAVRARCIVGADGRQSLVARLVQAPILETEPAHRGIYYCYVRNFVGPTGHPPDGPEFHRTGDEVAYVFPSDAGLTCIALSVSLATFAWLKQRPQERFRERIDSYGGLGDRFRSATPVDGLLACGPTRSYVRAASGRGWALVGDAGMHQDPWSGTGIDKAMVHATLLAEALGEWWAGAVPEREALERYGRLRDQDGLESYRHTTALSRDLRQLTAA